MITSRALDHCLTSIDSDKASVTDASLASTVSSLAKKLTQLHIELLIEEEQCGGCGCGCGGRMRKKMKSPPTIT
ncbi:hypothetical protein L2E82_27852 [Cichorium intybus]|uniref:Uncharacterized protein n=1 Tax=Cichorium intybus TaxID=13427 RepID=A0ACB9CU66_CICIN|nr:hypothetical protein L2E82_27852 [Cichorium intybus]